MPTFRINANSAAQALLSTLRWPDRGIHMRLLIALSLLIFAPFNTSLRAASLPPIGLAADGFPTGHESPEGAATDLGRAFVSKDAKAFEDASVRPYGGGEARQEYVQLLKQVVSSIRAEKQLKTPSPGGPKAIGKVFAARHLAANGPASYGNAAFSFQDIMFVDVGVFLHNGTQALNRTLVIKDRNGKWYAHPAPNVSPLLSQGLNEETPSTKDFSETSANK